MVYVEYKFGSHRDTATESNGNVWEIESEFDAYGTTRVDSQGRIEDRLTFAYQKNKNELRFIHVRDLAKIYDGFMPNQALNNLDYFFGKKGYLAVFLTSEEARDKYPKQYEELVAAVNKSNFYRKQNGYKLYLFYD